MDALLLPDPLLDLGEDCLKLMVDGPLVSRERLGGLLNYYYREAA